MQKSTALSAAVLLGLLIALPRNGVAQTAPEVGSHERSGFWFNGGLGYGSLSCDACTDREGGGTASLAAGGTVSQKVLVGASSNAWRKEIDVVTVTASALTAVVRFYPSATGGFYLQGGLGVGNLDVDTGSAEGSETGGAGIFGLGYDFRISPNVSLTPYLNGVGVTFEDGDLDFSQLGLSVTVH